MWKTFNRYLYPVEKVASFPQGFPQEENAISLIEYTFSIVIHIFHSPYYYYLRFFYYLILIIRSNEKKLKIKNQKNKFQLAQKNTNDGIVNFHKSKNLEFKINSLS